MSTPHTPTTGSHGGETRLAQELQELGYAGLFQDVNEDALDSIWRRPSAPETLARVAADPAAPVLARFLAAEILFYRLEEYPPKGQKRSLAAVYAAALAENLTEAANPWGLPGIAGGLAGDHLEALGEAAVPALIALMEDGTRVQYVGSKEATHGEYYGYRVKDLAAFFLARIMGLSFELDPKPGKRDREIENLKRHWRKHVE